jgi:CelD/BcsL family acetyltransferase involved in cellulose biosynthesis
MKKTMSSLLVMPSNELWGAFVESSPHANIFHHPTWIHLLADCYGYRPFVLAVCDDTGQIRAGLPIMEVNSPLTGRHWVALPFTDHCAPLSADAESLHELFASLADLQMKRAAPQLELRSAIPPDIQASTDAIHLLHLLSLSSDAQAVLRTFKRTLVQNRIRKAERDGVKVCWAKSRCDLETFYVLHWQTRQRVGRPVQPKRYFELLWQRLIEPGLGFILLAYKDGVPIAGGVFLAYKTTIMYKYGASDSAYWGLSPNHLLFWTAIRWGCEHGYTLFDWGRTEVTHTGLRDFKNTWGTQEIPLPYSILSATRPRPMTGRLTNLVERVIRNAPPSVCRLTGELLYRYFV